VGTSFFSEVYNVLNKSGEKRKKRVVEKEKFSRGLPFLNSADQAPFFLSEKPTK
jgi:hypothetical protein